METLLPTIHRLIQDGDLDEALRLAKRASSACPEFKPYSDKINYINQLISVSHPKFSGLKIALLSERYLNRFGVDRVFIMLAKCLIQMGHRPLLVGQRFEKSVIDQFETMLIEVNHDTPYIESDIYVAERIETDAAIRSGFSDVDFAISSGWPFFQSLRSLNRIGVDTYYYDFGIVPAFGLPEGTQKTLSLLQALKKIYISHATRGCGAISRFILRSQTAKCISDDVPLSPILLGVDHLDNRSLPSSSAQVNSCELLFLGRCELGNYKKSDLLPSLIESLRAAGCQSMRIGVLAKVDELPTGWLEMYPEVVALGHVSDLELQGLLHGCLGTFVLSSWEGFNLPLAESLAIGKPCFVFNVGAHPEVAAHPWLLCQSINEMATKISVILQYGTPAFLLPWLGSPYLERRCWSQTTNQIITQLTTPKKVAFSPNKPLEHNLSLGLFIDVTNSSRDPANSGVVRVTRRASAAIQDISKNGLQVIFVMFDSSLNSFRLLSEQEQKMLSNYNGPLPVYSSCSQTTLSTIQLARELDRILASADRVENKWFLLSEIHHGKHLDVARSYFSDLHGFKMAAIFYDMIPIDHPEYVLDPAFRDGHREYVASIAEYDILFPISSHAASRLSGYLLEQSIAVPTIKVVPLGTDSTKSRENSTHPIASASSESQVDQEFILCVSTLEPRKNHIALIEGFNLLCAKGLNPDNIRLVLVGNRYHGADELHKYIMSARSANALIEYKGIVTDDELETLYNACLFTVYPSLAEGYGLPIVESLLHNKPVMCHNEGSMAELASNGGCLAIDFRNIDSISEAFSALTGDLGQQTSLLKSLCREAAIIKSKTWSLYGEQIVGNLCIHHALNLEILP